MRTQRRAGRRGIPDTEVRRVQTHESESAASAPELSLLKKKDRKKRNVPLVRRPKGHSSIEKEVLTESLFLSYF